MSEKIKPSHLQKLDLKITAPMKMNDMGIEMGKLAVFVGANGSGKTFILKTAYALSMVGASQGGPLPPRKSAQFVFDNVFTDQKINGTVKATYTKGSVSVDLNDGLVVNVDMLDLVDPVPMVYMSPDMRTFDQMSLYLRMKKEAGADPLIAITKMLQSYRLYNYTYMEAFIARCPIKIDGRMRQVLGGFDFGDPITAIEVDLDNCLFNAVLEDGTKKNIATYGNGHQAILNMFLGVGAA